MVVFSIILMFLLSGQAFAQKPAPEERLSRIEQDITAMKQDIAVMKVELKAVNQRIDDTNKRIDDTNKRIDDFRADVNKRFEELRADTNKRFEELRADTNKRFEELRTDTNKRFEELRTDTSKRFDDLNRRLDTLERWLQWIFTSSVLVLLSMVGGGVYLWRKETRTETLLADHLRETEKDRLIALQREELELLKKRLDRLEQARA
jgi:vacuolar-type H+-ATPase subunit I/STV1